jgi:predicted CoA-substrate-specific enzyme activase
MIALGCDVGSRYLKLAVVDQAGEALRAQVIETTGTASDDLGRLFAALPAEQRAAPALYTGCGASFGAERDHEDPAVCVAAAARFLLPEVCCVIDVGAQSISAIVVDGDGQVLDLVRNDKCASGTGRFLEVMSAALGVQSVAELDELAGRARGEVALSSQCGVFVESEVVTHLNAGVDAADVAAGLCDAAARIVATQARRLSAVGPYTLTGGVARLRAFVERVRRRLPSTYLPFPAPAQLATAIGAGLLALGQCDGPR